MRTIALEEHFSHPAMLRGVPPQFGSRLLDLGELRLREMDEARIDVQILSHFPNGAQNLPSEEALRLSRETNDLVQRTIETHPDRFAGFAALPLSSPDEAAAELRRCVQSLGFKGAMVHGMVNGVPLDDKRFWGVWQEAESLDVPVYVHPDAPPQAVVEAYYDGHPSLIGPGWSYTVETATQALRLILGGVFDAFPRLKIILGHLGESLPFSLVRCAANINRRAGLKRPLEDYFHEHFWLTAAGNFSQPALKCCIAEMGIDRVMFSVDWPFCSNLEARQFIDAAAIGPSEREKVLGGTAAALLRL